MRFSNQQHISSYGRLNGSTHYASVPNFSDALGGISKITVSCWFKFGQVHTSERTLFRIRFPVGFANIYLNKRANSSMRFYIYDSGTSNNVDSPPIVTNQWYHIALTANLLTDTYLCYLNGVLVGIATLPLNDTEWATGAQQTSYFGADAGGSSALDCNMRDMVICPGIEATSNQIADLYQKGHAPPNAYRWPCDDSRGTVLACYRDDERYPMYDAALQVGTNLFSLDVPIPPRISDLDTNYVWLDGTADCYTLSDEVIVPYMLNAPILAQSGWAYLDRLPSGIAGIMFIPDSASGSGFVLDVQTTGLFRAIARSRNAGFASVMSPSTNHWANGYPIRQWFHLSQEADYANKVHRCWLNGRLVRSDTAVAWEDLTYQCTSSGGSSLYIGFAAVSWPGRLGPCRLFRPARAMTNAQAFDLYAKDELPYNAQSIIDFRIPNLIAPVDISPQAFPVTPISIAAPYGPKHRMYGGIGR